MQLQDGETVGAQDADPFRVRRVVLDPVEHHSAQVAVGPLQLLGRRPLAAQTVGGGKIETYHRHVLDRLTGMLTEGIRLGQVRPINPRVGANILYSIILSIPQYLVLYPEDGLERSFPKLVEEVARFAWAGIRKEATP